MESGLNASQLDAKHELIHQTLTDGSCALCERELDGSTRPRLRDVDQQERLGSLTRVSVQDMADLHEQLRICDRFRTDGQLDLLKTHEDERLEARSNLYRLSEEEDKFAVLMPTVHRGSDRETQMIRLQEVSQEQARALRDREDAANDLAEKRDEAARLQGRINRITSDPSIQMKARISRLAVEAFKKALAEFRERAQQTVEDEASKVFRKLVDEPGYEGIRIDESYKLTAVDGEGHALPIPSAGGQQLVTLSLIGGLNEAAVHEAPVIMDTPAGRIDRPNRERILRWVSGLGRQTVLMVHSGEFEPQEVMAMGIPVAALVSN